MTDKEALKVEKFLEIVQAVQAKGRLYTIRAYIYYYDGTHVGIYSIKEFEEAFKYHRKIQRISYFYFSFKTKNDYPTFYYHGSRHINSYWKLLKGTCNVLK